MKVTVALIDKLIALAAGDTLPDSQLRGEWFAQLQEDGLLTPIIHGSRKSWRARSGEKLRQYLADKYGLLNLEECRAIKIGEESSRAVQVTATGNSKFVQQRTFKGFLATCYEPINAMLNGEKITLMPSDGLFLFIYDYERFEIPTNVTVVGIENAENFRFTARQKAFFERNITSGGPLLFVSRYPQGQSRDLIKWLQSIPNKYVHFGDLDLAGVNIYLSEFYKHLGEKASMLIPQDYEERIGQGSPERYETQYQQLRNMQVTDSRVAPLVACIHRHHRGYDQEGYILFGEI